MPPFSDVDELPLPRGFAADGHVDALMLIMPGVSELNIELFAMTPAAASRVSR